MGKIASATFYDASGTGYAFIAYPLDSSFANDGAVYVFSQRTTDATGKGTHKLIYIGETGELGDSIINHEKWPCIANMVQIASAYTQTLMPKAAYEKRRI